MKTVKLLLDRKARVDPDTAYGCPSPLHGAVASCRHAADDSDCMCKETVRILLEAGADPNVVSYGRGIGPDDNKSPLMLASEYASSDIIKLLLDHGADMDPEQEWTPLLSAINRNMFSETLL